MSETIQINQADFKVVVTNYISGMVAMTQSTIKNPFNRIGIVTGEPGTGKTIAGYYLSNQLNGYRFCCSDGMTRKDLLAMIAGQFHQLPVNTSYSYLKNLLYSTIKGKLLILDEANHLGWRHLEVLRYLADEAGAVFIIIGTDILTQTLEDRKTGIYLAQFNSRIGVKRSKFMPIGKNESKPSHETLELIQNYFIKPYGWDTKKKTVVTAFYKHTKGVWRVAVELCAACQELMSQTNSTELTIEIVESAGKYLKLN